MLLDDPLAKGYRALLMSIVIIKVVQLKTYLLSLIGTLELNNHEPVLCAKCFGNTYSTTNGSRPQSLYQPVFPTIQKGLTWLAKTLGSHLNVIKIQCNFWQDYITPHLKSGKSSNY